MWTFTQNVTIFYCETNGKLATAENITRRLRVVESFLMSISDNARRTYQTYC